MIQDATQDNLISEKPRIAGMDDLDIATGNSRFVWVLSGVAIGMAAMFLLDPQSGRRRRASLTNRAAVGGGRVRDLASRVSQPVREMVERRFSGSPSGSVSSSASSSQEVSAETGMDTSLRH